MQRTDHGARGHDELNHIRDNEHGVVGSDSIGHPQGETGEQDELVPDRDVARRLALEHPADLQQRGDPHEHSPGCGGNSKDFDHEGCPFDMRSCVGAASARE